MAATMKKVWVSRYMKNGFIELSCSVFHPALRTKNIPVIISRQAHYNVALDDRISEDMKHLKFRHHPGIVDKKAVQLPDALQENIKTFMKKYPIRELDEKVHDLSNYLKTRKRPVETAQLRAKAKQLHQQMGMPDLDDINLNVDIAEKQRAMAKIKQRLRKEVYHWKPINYDEHTSVVYMMSRLSPNYAITYRILNEIKQRESDFKPEAVLDFGSGIGSTVWAAHSLFGDMIKEYYCVEESRAMNQLSDTLMKNGDPTDDCAPVIDNVYQRYFMPMSLKGRFDITISNFSLLDLKSYDDRMRIIDALWEETKHFMILVETGSMEGYLTLMEARDRILAQSSVDEEKSTVFDVNNNVPVSGDKNQVSGDHNDLSGDNDDGSRSQDLSEAHSNVLTEDGFVFAPCPHDVVCPRLEADSTPCNFEQKYFSLRKGKSVETERFCYLVLQKGTRPPGLHWPRIIRPVLRRSKHVICRMCCADGNLKEATLTKQKHAKEVYRSATASRWGDRLPFDVGDIVVKDKQQKRYSKNVDDNISEEEDNR